MKKATLAIALTLVCGMRAMAQTPAGHGDMAAKNHGCMMMSDSTTKALALTADQIKQVKESDAKCMKACEQGGYGKTGKMDQAAMSTHDAEMKKILNADQYTKWNAMCNTSKADIGTHPANKY